MPRSSRIGGFCLALLLHLLGLWMVLEPDTPELMPPSAGSETLTYIAPLVIAPPSPAIAPAEPAPSSSEAEKAQAAPPPPSRKPSRPLRQARRSTAPLPNPDVTMRMPEPRSSPEPAAVQPPVVPPPEDDFSARLDAARKRREAQTQDRPQADDVTESQSQRADRIARDNIAFQQRGQGAQRDQSGGVFQLRSVRLHNAQFMFRGWNTNFKRDSAQIVDVEQGAEPDIETAVVKRMIALIRTQKPGKFVWKSIRAGRLVNLDASPGYDEELQQFLMKEFFPDYQLSRGR